MRITGALDDRSTSEARSRSTRCVATSFLLLLAAWYAVCGPKVSPGQWTVDARSSAPFREALAWLDGRLDLPDQGPEPLHSRLHDTAFVASTGKVYSVTPPMLTLLCLASAVINRHVLDVEPAVMGAWALMILVILPLLALSYWAFRATVSDPAWAAFLALAFLGATALYPLMVWSRGGNAGYLNQVLSQIGLLLIFGDLLGRRRFWPAAIGLPIAAWSRQFTILYALPTLYLAWRDRRRRELAVCGLSLAVSLGAMLTLNHLKFGSPFETGYRFIYEGRGDDDVLALRAREGLFSTRWAPDNLYYLLVALPDVSLTPQGLNVTGSVIGNSMLISTPLFALLFAAAGGWWKDPARRAAVLATMPVLIGILLYHAPGFLSPGCYRFSTDFAAVWLLAAAPTLISARWRWWTLGCVAWSLVYFQLVTRVESV